MALPESLAREWIERWDRQQETYLPDREERFAVIADIVAIVTGKPDPVVLDVGCGPGSLSARVRARIPQARLIGVDSDPLLLGLARAGYPWLDLVDQDLRGPQWTQALPKVDAVVSTTALHWLQRDELAKLYGRIAEILLPGGVFVNGDHMADEPNGPGIDRICEQLREAQATRHHATGEDWAQWWAAVHAAPEFAELAGERRRRGIHHDTDGNVGLDEQVKLLRAAGFAEAGAVWQFGHDRVVVGIR